MDSTKYILKSSALNKINAQMEQVEVGSLRYQILQKAKEFKSSWIEFSQALYPVWRDKLYKEWGYITFEGYVIKEVGIRNETAMKLLRSYSFLEKEEPRYISKQHYESVAAGTMPYYESVDILRRAKDKGVLQEDDYTQLREKVLEKGREPKEIKKELTAIIRKREEATPEEAREKDRLVHVRRMVTTLKMLKRDMEMLKILPAALVKETEGLIKKIEQEMDRKNEKNKE